MNNVDVVTAFLNALKSKGINISAAEIQAAIAQAVLFAEYALPGLNGAEKKAWVLNKIVAAFESIDHLIPYIGKFMDFPIVDKIEYNLLDRAVQQVFDKLNEQKLVNVK